MSTTKRRRSENGESEKDTPASLFESLQRWTDLADKETGSRVIFATDEWFAHADNLLNASTEPQFDPNAYCPFGKVMDGWESRRRRKAGHDWCIIELGLPGTIRGVRVNTRWFTGNYVPAFSVQAANLATKPDLLRAPGGGQDGTCASEEQEKRVAALESDKWETIIPKTNLGPGVPETCMTVVGSLNATTRYTHIRLNMFPDGGIARLNVFGQVMPDWDGRDLSQPVDLLHVKNGGRQISWSDAHFGQPSNLLAFGRSKNMAGGWETARHITRPHVLEIDGNDQLISPDDDWCVLAVGRVGIPEKIEIDTNHFKGNYPESVKIECVLGKDGISPLADLSASEVAALEWQPLLDRVKLEPHKEHYYNVPADRQQAVSHVRVTIYPDGGISRVRLIGKAQGG